MTTGYFARLAWLAGEPVANVRLQVDGGRFTAVDVGAVPGPSDRRLPGLVLPGFANTHSHAFHRALRGRTHDQGGTFWTWRERMYHVSGVLDPDRYFLLARAVFAEMALAGVCSVGEFHYLHNAPGGVPYEDPNAMGRAIVHAAAEAGVRVTVLDACYLAGGLRPDGPLPLAPPQQRFSDGSADAWRRRVEDFGPLPAHARLGAAVHSVRAVPRAALGPVVDWADGGLLHVHLSEQPAENEQCARAYGCTPTELLAAAGAWRPGSCAVHATHLSTSDIGLLGASGTSISMCPSTERDLADGIGPARALFDAGAPITLGSDQHAVIDPLAEAQALEMDERLATGARGRFSPAALVDALTESGQRALGWPDAGVIAASARADLVAVRLDTVRTAGADPAQVVLAASAADIDTVLIDGVEMVTGGRHRLGDVGRLLGEAVEPLWADSR
jgi:formiminoglutamate deiminase